MVTHIVLFKLADPTAENVTATRNKLLSFAGGGYTIPDEGIDQ